MEIGIVGLPNSGKTTLFNSLTNLSMPAENYPFTTIEPNIGATIVTDPRLDLLAKFYPSAKITPAAIKFIDIAGLISGAARGEGLGNQFLSHIRAVTAILIVVRAFHDSKVSHIYGRVSPADDLAILDAELIMADLNQAEKIYATYQSKAARGDHEANRMTKNLAQAISIFKRGQALRRNQELAEALRPFNFLTSKKELIVFNISDDFDAKNLPTDRDYFKLDVKQALLNNQKFDNRAQVSQHGHRANHDLTGLIKQLFKILGLITFYSANQNEVRAWLIEDGATALMAAEKIHSDFAEGFIAAKIYSIDDLIKLERLNYSSQSINKQHVGKNYRIRDGEVIEVLFRGKRG